MIDETYISRILKDPHLIRNKLKAISKLKPALWKGIVTVGLEI